MKITAFIPKSVRLEGKDLNILPGKLYTVLAVEFTSETHHAFFWVAGEHFDQRCKDGVIYPDLIKADSCSVVDSKVPDAWVLAVNHYENGGTRTIVGPPSFIGFGFLESVIDNNPLATAALLAAVASS